VISAILILWGTGGDVRGPRRGRVFRFHNHAVYGSTRTLTSQQLVAAASTVLAAFARIELSLPRDLGTAADAGQLRLVFAACMPGQPLPSDWAVPLENADEVVLAVARLPPDLPCTGFVAVVARAGALRTVAVDDDVRNEIAVALADALARGL
jgi:hypothetical protein